MKDHQYFTIIGLLFYLISRNIQPNWFALCVSIVGGISILMAIVSHIMSSKNEKDN